MSSKLPRNDTKPELLEKKHQFMMFSDTLLINPFLGFKEYLKTPECLENRKFNIVDKIKSIA
jgi:hypothetical protein